MNLREKLYVLVEDHESPQGKVFDYSIQALILLSLFAFALDTLPNNSAAMEGFLNTFELICIIIFTIEYLLRIYVSKKS